MREHDTLTRRLTCICGSRLARGWGFNPLCTIHGGDARDTSLDLSRLQRTQHEELTRWRDAVANVVFGTVLGMAVMLGALALARWVL